MTIELTILISFVGVTITVSSFFIGRQVSAKNDGVKSGALDTMLQYLTKSMEEIKMELKEANLVALKIQTETDIAALKTQANESKIQINDLKKYVEDDIKRRIDKHDLSIERIHEKIEKQNK